MKLHEFEIRDARSRKIRNRDPVSGGNRRVRRLAVNRTGAARGKQHGARAFLAQRSAAIEITHACDAAVFIPMYGKGLSLNVHVALAVVLYHIRHGSF